MGEVCGVVLKHPSEKVLYVAGDTVWYDAIEDEISTTRNHVVL
jgi:hypothetical protein